MKFRAKFARFIDDCKMAAMGIVLASRRLSFWIVFVIVFIVFGTLISLLSSGSSAIDLFFATDFGGKLQILGDGFLTLFGKGREFWDFFVNFSLAILQAILIALIVMIFRKRKARALRRTASEKDGQKKNIKNGERAEKVKGVEEAEKTGKTGIQNAGIAAGLALLGSGCPTCGTTLITPILASFFSTGSYAIAGTISGILTFIAFILILWSLKKVGLEVYVIIKDEEWRMKRAKREKTRSGGKNGKSD